jgi:hypothetical protein
VKISRADENSYDLSAGVVFSQLFTSRPVNIVDRQLFKEHYILNNSRRAARSD